MSTDPLVVMIHDFVSGFIQDVTYIFLDVFHRNDTQYDTLEVVILNISEQITCLVLGAIGHSA